MNRVKFALMIDAENISQKYIHQIIDEISKFGDITYKRVYRDWTNPAAIGWKEIMLQYALIPVQQYSYTTGKNATDFAIIIDAMDILYEGNVDGFCLVTSDSDFTRLACRLREAGKRVIGFGEQKTPASFMAACEKFIVVDKNDKVSNVKHELQAEKKDKTKSLPKKDEIEVFLIQEIERNTVKGKITDLGQVGSRLSEKYPGFSLKHYNYSQLSKFIASFEKLYMDKINNKYIIYKKSSDCTLNQIEQQVVQFVRRSGKKGMDLGELNKQLMILNKGFNTKKYGYSKFLKMVLDFPSVKIETVNGGKNKIIKVVD